MLRATCLTRADRGNGLAGKARSHRTAIWSMIPAVTYAKMKRRPCRPFRHALLGRLWPPVHRVNFSNFCLYPEI